jgi:hypothetical protein
LAHSTSAQSSSERVREDCLNAFSAKHEDRCGPASAQTIRRVASDVKEVLIKRCGHYVPEERPVELAGAIMDFLIKSSSGH